MMREYIYSIYYIKISYFIKISYYIKISRVIQYLTYEGNSIFLYFRSYISLHILINFLPLFYGLLCCSSIAVLLHKVVLAYLKLVRCNSSCCVQLAAQALVEKLVEKPVLEFFPCRTKKRKVFLFDLKELSESDTAAGVFVLQ